MATHSRILAWRLPMERGAWRAIVHGIAESWTHLKQLRTCKLYINRKRTNKKNLRYLFQVKQVETVWFRCRLTVKKGFSRDSMRHVAFSNSSAEVSW